MGIEVEKAEPGQVWPDADFDGDVVVLPREEDETGRGVYDDSVVTVVKELRGAGVVADFRDAADSRVWAGEEGTAVIVLNVVLGVVSNAGWAALCWILRRNHPADRVRIRVARFRKSGSTVAFDWYKADGPGEAVAAALEAIEPPEQQRPELEQKAQETADAS
jgi:hypothetical protein